MTNNTSQTHDDLVHEVTGYVTDSLGHWHGEEDYEKYQELCPPAFKKLSRSTLELLAMFGRNHGRDAVPEHLGVRALINSDADERYYIYYGLMQEIISSEEEMSTKDFGESELVTPVCISFELYDPYIDLFASSVPKHPAARTEYYRAVGGVVISLLEQDKDALAYVQVLTESEESKGYVIDIGEYEALGPSPVIKDEVLIETVIRNVHRADEIMDCIRNRGMSSAEDIAGYLNDYHPAVSSGVL
jgi:hypothetical protein